MAPIDITRLLLDLGPFTAATAATAAADASAFFLSISFPKKSK